MKIRRYDKNTDFDKINSWVDNEYTHALWCACRTAFPLEREGFEGLLSDIKASCGDEPFCAEDDSGEIVGFFCYSQNIDTQEGMLKFVIVSKDKRGKGLGREMLTYALRLAFGERQAKSVRLMVFLQNERAIRCYESVGFKVRHTERDAFCYKNEKWSRCSMVIEKEDFSG
jgi:RimJ/RimL family protein N-acetyltransferase